MLDYGSISFTSSDVLIYELNRPRKISYPAWPTYCNAKACSSLCNGVKPVLLVDFWSFYQVFCHSPVRNKQDTERIEMFCTNGEFFRIFTLIKMANYATKDCPFSNCSAIQFLSSSLHFFLSSCFETCLLALYCWPVFLSWPVFFSPLLVFLSCLLCLSSLFVLS